jgi:hypothetical protein
VKLNAAAIVAALIALVAVVETGAALTARLRVATDADWEAAAAEVRSGFQPGDLVAFAPAWADQVGRAHLGDLVTVEMAGRSDADRYARVWEVSIRGAHSPDVEGAKRVRASQHGKVRVALYEKAATPVVYDFTSHAQEVIGGRYDVRTLEIDYRPRRGILVQPSTQPATYEWHEVPLGDTLVVYAGLHDYYARKSADGLVDFAVLVDGRELVAARVGNDDGWRRFDLDTHALAGGRHTVTMRVSAQRPAWRNFGFHMEARQK